MTKRRGGSRRVMRRLPSERAVQRMTEMGRRAVERRVQALEVEGYVIARPGDRSNPARRWTAKVRFDSDPWLALYQSRFFEEELQKHRGELVAACRHLAYDWGSIATALGVSEPTARRHFGWVDDGVPESDAVMAVVEQAAALAPTLPRRQQRRVLP